MVEKSTRGGENTIRSELECIQRLPTTIVASTGYKNQIQNLPVQHLLQAARRLETIDGKACQSEPVGHSDTTAICYHKLAFTHSFRSPSLLPTNQEQTY